MALGSVGGAWPKAMCAEGNYEDTQKILVT